jgi:hypothetical protein
MKERSTIIAALIVPNSIAGCDLLAIPIALFASE